MLKPERSWAVGDKLFKTYDEARAYVSSRRGDLQRSVLIDTLDTSANWGLCHSDIADAILAKFKLTPRK